MIHVCLHSTGPSSYCKSQSEEEHKQRLFIEATINFEVQHPGDQHVSQYFEANTRS